MEQSWTDVTVSWKGENTFLGSNPAGGSVQLGPLDGHPGVGPMQLLLVALGGCTGVDIVSILEKKKLALVDFQVRVKGRRATDYPMVWTDIQVEYLLWGEAIPPKDVEQAIRLSEEKYCSVGIMLAKTATITSTYRILRPGEKA